jgi:predicted acylesterase/phospholipase RssA
VLAALLAAAQGVNERERDALRIDAMSGASAGSITALLAARALLAGLDPIDVMYGAWVEAPQLAELRDGNESPLSVEHTRARAAELLRGHEHPERSQASAIRVHMALGCLRGLDYRIGRIGGPPIPASTYLDWAEWQIDRRRPLDWYTADNGPVHAALASGAHAAAFPPQGLDRGAADVQAAYERNGVEGFPPSKFLWYTDGGTIDNEPLGRALGLTNELDSAPDDPLGDAARLHMMISPDPARPTVGDDAWSTRAPTPTWPTTGLRAAKLLRVQRLYDDLREVEKTNSRIAWTRQVEETLVSIMSGQRRDAERALAEVADRIAEQKAALTGPEDVRTPTRQPDSPLAEAVRSALDAATGLSRKREVAVSVVSPLVLPEVADGSTNARKLLAGEFLGHFGGFLSQGLRENDFALGYRCMLCWLDQRKGLERHGLDPELARRAVESAVAARAGWERKAGRAWIDDLGGTTLENRPLGEQLQVLRLAMRAAWIAFNQVRRDAGLGRLRRVPRPGR